MMIAWMIGLGLLGLVHGLILVNASRDAVFGVLYWAPMVAIAAFMLSSGVLAVHATRRWWRSALILWAGCAITYVSAPTPYGINMSHGAFVLGGVTGILVVGGSLAKERWRTSRAAASLGLVAAIAGWWPFFGGALRRIVLSGYSANYGIGATVTWLKQFTAILAVAAILNVFAALVWHFSHKSGSRISP